MTPLIGPVRAPDLHVMTFNVRRRLRWTARPSDRWALRAPLVQALLAAERPDLLAAQEVLPDQARVLGAALGDRYRRIGEGRSPGPRGEATPILYDSSRLDLLEWTQRALSDRPEEPGSRTWGNAIPRVFVEAVLRDLETTFGGYRRPRRGGGRIDHILTSPTIDVRRIGIHARPTSGGWPSDHLPVQAVLRVPRAAAE